MPPQQTTICGAVADMPAPPSCLSRPPLHDESSDTQQQKTGDSKDNVSARLTRILRPRRVQLLGQVHELSPIVDSTTLATPTLQDGPSTSISVHWDNLHVSGSSVRCRCCDALETGVKDYRYTVQLMYRRFLLAAQDQRCLWREERLTESAIATKTDELYARMMPVDGFFNQIMADTSDDELMAYIFTFTDLPFAVNGGEFDLAAAVHASTRRLCRDVLRPFAAVSTKELTRVRHAYAATSTGWKETITGKTASGKTIGFQYVAYLETPRR